MTSYVDTIRDAITSSLDNSEALVRDAMLIAPRLIRAAVHAAFNRQLATIKMPAPDPLVDAIANELINGAMDALRTCLEHISVLREAAAFLGSPDQLREMAEVFGAIGTEAQNLEIRRDDLQGYRTWFAGQASRDYESAIDAQIDDLARVQPPAFDIKDVLRTHADDIENYYVQLLELAVGLAVAIGGVVGAIVGVVGAALSAVPTAGVGAVVGVVAAAISLVMALGGTVVAGIGAVQLFLAATQGSANKLDQICSQLPTTWEGPTFADIQ